MWLALLVAVAAATPSWEDVVARLASPREARWTRSEALPHLEAACDAGHRAACRLELGESLSVVLAWAAASGDPAARLGHAWRIQDDAPEEAFALFEARCAEGSARACVAVAAARFEGTGTWSSRRRGRILAEGLCAEGVGEACLLLAEMHDDRRPTARIRLLSRARDLGASGASERLAELVHGATRERALREACTQGGPRACWSLAVEGIGDRRAHAVRACALGVEEACVTGAALALEAGEIELPEAIAMVDAHCREGVDEACIAARFYRNGGRPPAFPAGSLGDAYENLLVEDKLPLLLDCYRQRLEAGDTAVAELHLELAASATGRVVAVTAAPGDPMERCYADVLLGTQGLRPQGGPARFAIDVTLTHEARIDVDAVQHDEAGRSIRAAEWRFVSQLGLDANACYLEHGGSVFDRQFAIYRGTLRTTGFYAHEGVVESSGDDATDACIVALLQRLRVPEVDMPFDQEVFVRLYFNHLTRAPRWAGWGMRSRLDPPLDLSRHNHAPTGLGAHAPIALQE